MKALRKNGYAITVIALFTIAFAMLVLFLALFSSSTAVDGTVVGSVYIGDEKPNTEARKQKLIKGVNSWKKDARYTISLQNVSIVLGQSVRLDENGDPMYDLETGELLYDNVGLELLDFDYEATNRNIQNDKSDNDAVFKISDENKAALYQLLVDNFGSEVTSDTYLRFQALVDDIIKDANEMNTKSDYDLFDYLNTNWSDDLVAQIDIENLSVEKVNELVELFKDKKIELLPQKDPNGKLGFSSVDFFSQEEYSTMSSSDMSIIATGFAAVVQETSLTVTVKNQGYISDRYYAYNDMTARVNIKDGTDLRIINPETHSYIITIEQGEEIIDGKTSLKFKLNGCKFINKYVVTKNSIDIDFNTVYDEASTNFEYDPTNEYMGVDENFEGGCYYWIYQEGKSTSLYSYTKTTTFVDGKKTEIEVYPKQEFFVGQDELRMWTKNGYSA